MDANPSIIPSTLLTSPRLTYDPFKEVYFHFVTFPLPLATSALVSLGAFNPLVFPRLCVISCHIEYINPIHRFLFIKILFLVSFSSHWHTFGNLETSVLCFFLIILLINFSDSGYVSFLANWHTFRISFRWFQNCAGTLFSLFCGRLDHHSICYHC